jgi:hypothetical protein
VVLTDNIIKEINMDVEAIQYNLYLYYSELGKMHKKVVELAYGAYYDDYIIEQAIDKINRLQRRIDLLKKSVKGD